MKLKNINKFWAGSFFGASLLSAYYFAGMASTPMPHSLVVLVMAVVPLCSIVLAFTVNSLYKKPEVKPYEL